MQIVKSGLVYINKKFEKTDILVSKSKIIKINSNINISDYKGATLIDASNKIITPNFTDVHVHFRFPGQTYKENIETGVASAINGGYTTVVMMPNTKPVIDNHKILKQVVEKIKEQPINLKTYVAATIGQKCQKNVSYEKFFNNRFVAGFSDDGNSIGCQKMMKQIISSSQKHNFIIAAHLEDNKNSKKRYVINDCQKAKELGLVGCSSEVEYVQAKRDIELVKNYPKAKYHICHVSNKETLEIVKIAKMQNLNISCEVSPHHLLLSDQDIPGNNGLWKMNPPLKTPKDNEALINGLNNNLLEIIATDHAPHSSEEKNKGFESEFGIIGLDHCFSTLYTYLVKTKKVKIETIIEAMSISPNKIFGFHDPSIRENGFANFNIIDLNEDFILDKSFIKSKSKNTPFLNHKLSGKITHVFYLGSDLKSLHL